MFDLTGLKVLKEASESARLKGILVVFIQIHPELVALLRKFDIRNDYSSPLVDVDTYLALSKGLEFITDSTIPEAEAVGHHSDGHPLQDVYHRVQTEKENSKEDSPVEDFENVMK